MQGSPAPLFRLAKALSTAFSFTLLENGNQGPFPHHQPLHHLLGLIWPPEGKLCDLTGLANNRSVCSFENVYLRGVVQREWQISVREKSRGMRVVLKPGF